MYPAFVEPAVAKEIEAEVQDALANFGVSGTVVVRGKQIELHGRGPAVVIDLEHLSEQWLLLPVDLRQRKVTDTARRLVQAHRSGNANQPAVHVHHDKPPRSLTLPLGVVLLIAIGAFFAWRAYRNSTIAPPPPDPIGESPAEAEARRARVCEAARKRMYAGASMGAFDTEGWVAELWIATSKSGQPIQINTAPPGEEPTVDVAPWNTLIEHGKLTAEADAALAALSDGQVRVVNGFGPDETPRTQDWVAVTVRFSGRYMSAYLDPAMRSRFQSLADRMADAMNAELGALYGRCAHLRYRDLGAWFRGPDAPSAATALVYAAGFFAEMPTINQSAVASLGGPSVLSALRTSGGKLDVNTLGKLVGQQGGSISTSSNGAVVMTFPFGGPTRATAASRIVARKLGVGVGED